MLKPRGAVCNLDCNYCYYLAKERLYPGSRFRMADDLLEQYTRQYIQAQRVDEVTFAWQGGEPTLMGLDFFRRAVELQNRHRPNRMRIFNTIQTNGTLLNDEWCVFLKQNDFLVGLSIDGPQLLHDAYRLDKVGRGTFSQVIHGLQLLKKHDVEINVLTCLHAANAAHPYETYRFLCDVAGIRYIQFIPVVEWENVAGLQEGTKVSQRSITAEQYGEFLINVFDTWVRRDVGRIFVQIFEVALAAWAGLKPGLCVFEETCGAALAMEHNGDLYSCDHFVEPRHFLGNIREEKLIALVGSEQQRRFGRAKRDSLPRYCLECEVRFVCNGGCPKDRIIETPSGEQGLNYLCEGYKAFFTHIGPAMSCMAAELRAGRAPANVMRDPAIQTAGSPIPIPS